MNSNIKTILKKFSIKKVVSLLIRKNYSINRLVLISVRVIMCLWLSLSTLTSNELVTLRQGTSSAVPTRRR